MIEKMKFISISGPKDDLDRMVNQNLSHYEIQFENAMTELRSVAKLVPYPGENPYKEPFVYHQFSDKLRLNMDVDLLLKLIQFNAES